MNLLSRREVKLEKKVLKISLLFRIFFRNRKFITSCGKGGKCYVWPSVPVLSQREEKPTICGLDKPD